MGIVTSPKGLFVGFCVCVLFVVVVFFVGDDLEAKVRNSPDLDFLQIAMHLRKNLSRVTRTPVFGVADQVRHKPDCTATVLRCLEA